MIKLDPGEVAEQEVPNGRRPGAERKLRCRDLTFGSWRSLGPWSSMIAFRHSRKLLPTLGRGFVC